MTSPSHSPASRVEFLKLSNCLHLTWVRSCLRTWSYSKTVFVFNLPRLEFSSSVLHWVRRFCIDNCLSNNHPHLSIFLLQFPPRLGSFFYIENLFKQSFGFFCRLFYMARRVLASIDSLVFLPFLVLG